MKPIVRIENNIGTLILIGPFDFNLNRDFRQASQELLDASAVQEIQIDFDQVWFVENAALGMLLLLHERATSQKKTVVLLNCRESVMAVFEIANFNKIFTFR